MFLKMDLKELFEEQDMDVEVNEQEEEEMEVEVNEEEEEEMDDDDDAILSDDSCYDSERPEDIPEEIFRVLNQAEVNTLNPLKKMCCTYFYYTPGNAKFCALCIVRISGLFSWLYAVRKHDTRPYLHIDGVFCSECRDPLFQIMPCNLCPICTI